MGKNYKETRERLRRLLNKKKSKRRTCPIPSNVIEKRDNENPKVAPPPAATVKPKEDLHREQKKTSDESRILKNLLDFIEGTEAPHRNEKKAAKRARQKEKKQMLLLQLKREQEEKARQLEEERLRKEREALMLENLRKASSKKKKSRKKKQGGGAVIDEPSLQKKNTFSFSQTNSSNPGSQMVTIKRVMEPNDSEPTVTITLRGATPKQDKVLYTLFNGKVCESMACPKGQKNPPKDLKITKETERNSVRKLDPPKNPIFNPIMVNDKVSRGNFNYPQPPPPPPSCQRPFKELTNPTSIQISNAVTSMSKNGYHDFNFDGIRLPPGITITKVDPCDAKIRPLPKTDQDTKNQVSLKPVPKVSKRTPTPEVIIVSTNKLKEESSASSKPSKAESSSLPGPSSKKPKKKKNKTTASKPKIPSAYPGLDIEIIKSVDGPQADLCNQMSVLTINPYADNKGSDANPPVTQTTKKRRKKKKKKSNKPEGEIDSEEWNSLDNVFAPKDIDLNDGEIDDAERELEAFKLFCMQSVPLKRQEKVNLNLKDLVLKKKSVSCS